MIRGDTIDLSLKIKQGQQYVDCSTYSEIEVQFNPQSAFNSVKKLKSKNEVVWDSVRQAITVSLSQNDTFKLSDGECEIQVRLFISGTCTGTTVGTINIGKVLSNEVLQ